MGGLGGLPPYSLSAILALTWERFVERFGKKSSSEGGIPKVAKPPQQGGRRPTGNGGSGGADDHDCSSASDGTVMPSAIIVQDLAGKQLCFPFQRCMRFNRIPPSLLTPSSIGLNPLPQALFLKGI